METSPLPTWTTGMIDRMAVEQMPKSSVEYILRKGAEGSLLGLAQGMMKSPLQQEIERRGEAAYRPSGAEKAWGTAVGVGMDTVMMGGISSWGSLIKLGGVEAVSYAVGKFMDGTEDAPAMTVEDCISRGVFGSEHNVFADFRAQGKVILRKPLHPVAQRAVGPKDGHTDRKTALGGTYGSRGAGSAWVAIPGIRASFQ